VALTSMLRDPQSLGDFFSAAAPGRPPPSLGPGAWGATPMGDAEELRELREYLVTKIDPEKAARKVERVKRKQRTSLSLEDWRRHDFSRHPWTAALSDLTAARQRDTVGRVDARACGAREFEARYEATLTPVVLTHVTDTWAAPTRWRYPSLCRMLGRYEFRCGEDDAGYPLKLKFKYFLHYALTTDDDAPLYLFDGGFPNRGADDVTPEDRHRRGGGALLHDYEVPPYFRADLLRYSGRRNRPPYRWFVLGPPRSGTSMHQDPLGTAAWNALVHGHKRWVLFPPQTPRDLIKPRMPSGDREAIHWFHRVYPRMLEAGWQGPKPVEVLQSPVGRCSMCRRTGGTSSSTSTTPSPSPRTSSPS